ncbi:MAG: hypothetical protein GWP08_16895 [Nitrospiraceae bacterium]|nr:hypothetical protein [Nitrospiraceae bacterium]
MRLGGYEFLDLASSETVDDFEGISEAVGSWAFLQVPAHFFIRLERTDDSIEIAMLDYDWLKEALAQKKVRLDYTLEDDRLLLTASTSKLRRFVKKYAGNDETFDSLGDLRRTAAAAE